MKCCIQMAVAQLAIVCAPAMAASHTSILYYAHDAPSELQLADVEGPLSVSRPRLNDSGEVVWRQTLQSAPNAALGIYSSVRGLLTADLLPREPDVNNRGEVIWEFGTSGGIGSTRGVILEDGSDSARINNAGEVFAFRNGSVWSNVRGTIPTVPGPKDDLEVNDSGEVVYPVGGVIYSTLRGAISGTSWFADNPDINNLGEMVWQQASLFPPSGRWEIWSNLRGKIGEGTYPAISDNGEIVWSWFDGHDSEIVSNIRGQLTFNDEQDGLPRINSSGDMAWLREIPEPASETLLVASATFLFALIRCCHPRKNSAVKR
jgi:hypothetical protein